MTPPPFSFMTDVVDPLGYALLAPAPWQAGGLLELAASAEMTVWYVLLLASLFAFRDSPRQPLFLLALIVYGVANWLILAAVEGNVGNLLRHRLMLDPVLLILGAAGLEWAWLRLRRVERLDLIARSRARDDKGIPTGGKSHVNTRSAASTQLPTHGSEPHSFTGPGSAAATPIARR